MESFLIPGSRSGGWNFRECTSPFPSLDLNMFSLEVSCMKVVCVVNQQEIALVIDKSTRFSKFYKSKNTHCRCDISSCSQNLWFSTTIKNIFVHVTLEEFALCYAVSKEWWVTSKTSPSKSCQKQCTYKEPVQEKNWRTAGQVSPGWSPSSLNYQFQFPEETLMQISSVYGE